MRPEVEKAVELLQTGKPDGIEQAVALLQNTVFSFSMRVCGHREDAEDTMQEVLTKAVRYVREFTSAQALSVWLYTVAKNRCLMSRRHSKFVHEKLSLDELMPDAVELERLAALGPQVSTPESDFLRNEGAEGVRAAIHKIPPQYRLILVLHDMEELSTAEIASITGLREGTVRVRLHRARLFARKELIKTALLPHQAKTGLGGDPDFAPRPADSGDDPSTPDSVPLRGTGRRTARSRGSLECKQIFAELSDYLDGILDLPTCEHLQQHMASCKPCEAFLATLRMAVQQIKRVEAEVPGPASTERIRQLLAGKLQQALSAAKVVSPS